MIRQNEDITWGGSIEGIFYGEHRFKLTGKDDGKTVLDSDEDFSGFGIIFADLPRTSSPKATSR